MRYSLLALALAVALAQGDTHKHNHTSHDKSPASPKGAPAASAEHKHVHTKDKSPAEHKEKTKDHVEHAAAAARAEALGSAKQSSSPASKPAAPKGGGLGGTAGGSGGSRTHEAHKERRRPEEEEHAAAPSASPPPDVPPPSSSFGAAVSIACVVLLVVVGGLVYRKDILAMTTNLSSWGLQIGSFLVLVTVQASALLLFRICQTSGAYEFSPASSVALTEACKLVLAVSLHGRHVRESGSPPFENLNKRIVAHYFGLACCYTVNNQLTFYALQMVDPGTFGLGKSLAPYMVALMLRFTGQTLNQLQWVCILLQCICIAITQYNACKSAAVLSSSAYALLGVAVSITAVSSVWNQKVVKGFDVPVNLQNALLYSFGLAIAILSYVAIPDPVHTHGFFHGYSLLAVFLVVFQAFHGLAVTLVYK